MSIRIYQPEQAVPAWHYYFGERSTTNTTNHEGHNGIKTFVVFVVVRCVRCAPVFA
jgi:hypothetical protein